MFKAIKTNEPIEIAKSIIAIIVFFILIILYKVVVRQALLFHYRYESAVFYWDVRCATLYHCAYEPDRAAKYNQDADAEPDDLKRLSCSASALEIQDDCEYFNDR